MALNLSTLTNAATSGGILAEALTTADFLDPVPILKNLSRGSNKGGDAKQTTALNQPKALPLIKNPSGNLGGYLYIPNVAGNYATGPSVTIGSNETWEGELDMVITQWGSHLTPMGGGYWSNGFGLVFYTSGAVRLFSKASGAATVSSGVTLGTPFNVKYGFDGSAIYVDIDGARVYSDSSSGIVSLQSGSITHTLELNQQANIGNVGNYAIQKAKLTVNSAVVFDCDFNGSTSIRHGDTKFQASVGGPVTINKSGNDPATIIKKPVLRFANQSDDSANIYLTGLFNQTINDGYMFAAFSVLGDGGNDSGRVFSISSTGITDSGSRSAVFSQTEGTRTDLQSFYNGTPLNIQSNLFDESNGDILHESLIKNGSQKAGVNNANFLNTSLPTSIESEEFNISCNPTAVSARNTAIDLEYLALFPATITDAEADRVRDFINTRNNVFDLKDGFGYYFYDATKAPVGAITTGSASWNGRIVGSDNGDTDKFATQGTTNEEPVGDGYVVTFADNADHLDIPQVTLAAGDSYAWMVCGTSLGTFSYKVTVSGETELNLLGHTGHAVSYFAGDLYGIILLPESATGADIEAARKLLIDRGAADGASSNNINNYFRGRNDIVEFGNVNLDSVTNASQLFGGSGNIQKFNVPSLPNAVVLNSAWENGALRSFTTQLPKAENVTYAWYQNTELEAFSVDLPEVTDARFAWFNCTSLSDFKTTDIKNCSNFSNAWRSCSALTSFPSGAKLGTAASGVNFTSAWRSSGLTSFSTPLPTATVINYAWESCTYLTSFDLESLPLVTNAAYSFEDCTSISSFSSSFYVCKTFIGAWNANVSLADFSADVFANWNPSTLIDGCFNGTWVGCTSLTAQSVENILTSIDASGKYGTATGAAGGGAIDSGIDIDYDGTTLSAATNAAIDSLSGKGWEVYINGVLVIPNILDLAPAAAYSLRSFDANADPNVVKVRRSSDGATSDFKASEVSDGTLRDWTLGDTLSLENNRMYFDGVNDKVDVSGVDIGSYSEITIKTRFLWNNGIDANEGIFTNGSTSLNRFGLYVSSQLTFYLGDGSSTFYPSLVSLNENQYYTVVATAKVENGQMTANIFVEGLIDGTENSISTSATDFSVVAQDWVIGHLNVNRYFEGLIDYVDVYEGYSTDGSVTGMTQLHGWSNTNITDASWTDSVGSANGTVSGTPALFSGQGFDGHVTTWYDQGGTNHAAQSDDAKQPKIVDGGTLVTDGGLAAVDFDGTDDSLKYSGDLFGTNTAAMFIVNSFDVATATKRDVIAGGQDTSGTRYDFVIVRQSSSGMQPYIEGSGFSGGISTTDTNQHLYSVTHNSGTSTGSFNRDGVTTATPSSSASVTSATDFVIGTDISSPSDSLNGQIQEIVVFNTDQSANRTGIEKNINDTYTIY